MNTPARPCDLGAAPRRRGSGLALVLIATGAFLFLAGTRFGGRPENSRASELVPPATESALRSLADSPSLVREPAPSFRELIRQDPRGTYERIQAEAPAASRAELQLSALALWAETDPVGAALAARSLPLGDRSEAVAAVLAGASRQPDEVRALGEAFCQDDPVLSQEHGYALIAALGRGGHYAQALDFALATDAFADADTRTKWTKDLFSRWAENDPAAAYAAANRLTAEGLRFEALDAFSPLALAKLRSYSTGHTH